MQRPLCRACNQNPVAVNYHRQGKIYYRKLCDGCQRRGRKIKPTPPSWFKAGYRKKDRCDMCNWRARYPERQMTVFHVDGNLRNNSDLNLRTICLNCRVEIAMSKLPWREAEIKPDF